MHYLLFYEVAEDYVARRAEFRAAHLEKAWEASARGELVLGGALANPVDGAVLLFQGDSPEVAEKSARADPYVTSGAVKRWYVREWTTGGTRGGQAHLAGRREGVRAASQGNNFAHVEGTGCPGEGREVCSSRHQKRFSRAAHD
jgi:uncharacterized protein YciI